MHFVNPMENLGKLYFLNCKGTIIRGKFISTNFKRKTFLRLTFYLKLYLEIRLETLKYSF